MKTKAKRTPPRPRKRIIMDRMVPDSPQSAFIAQFAIRDESWPNVACSYLFAGNDKIDADNTRHL